MTVDKAMEWLKEPKSDNGAPEDEAVEVARALADEVERLREYAAKEADRYTELFNKLHIDARDYRLRAEVAEAKLVQMTDECYEWQAEYRKKFNMVIQTEVLKDESE
jgi:hypothetical protein